jgi:PAS domain S-box-containing protein
MRVREIANRLASIYIDVPALRPGTIGAYLLAFVAVGAATGMRLAIDPYVDGLQFATFFPAVIITTLIGGSGAGLFSVVLSVAAVASFVLPPRLALYVEKPGDVLALLLYTVVMLFTVAFIIGMRLAVKDLQESKDRLQSTLDAARLGSWRYDHRHRVFSWDVRSKEIFGVPEDGAPVEAFMNWVHPDDVEKVWAAYHRALDPAQPERSPTQFRLRRGNGAVRWVETQGLAHLESAGRDRQVASFVGTVQDITERKEREEREHLLMREINHRAKNMLSVVAAIAHQTATRTPETFIERFSERIQALAANQDLLIRNAWHGVEIEDLVRAQLAPFADLIGSRIVVRGPALRFNAASAQAIGLALHELATNAGKYGALSKDTGLLHIGWWAEGETFTMSWAEREGPSVSAPQRRGFGTTVMQQMAEHRHPHCRERNRDRAQFQRYDQCGHSRRELSLLTRPRGAFVRVRAAFAA